MTIISNLPALSTATNQIILPIVDLSTSPGITKKITLAQLVTLSKGPEGQTGPEGPSGPIGPAINISGTVNDISELPTTGTPGQTFVVADTGHLWAFTSNATLIDAGPILGPTGPAGPSGISGPTGPSGIAGPSGPTGIAGPTGPQGAQGEIGRSGIVGATGPAGPTGVFGATGAAGPTGPSGVSGINGTNGSNGLNGPTGPSGPTGADSTVPGPVGPSGPQGLRGEPGLSGGSGGTTVLLATSTIYGISKLSLEATDPNSPVVVGDNDPRMTDARVPLTHSHTQPYDFAYSIVGGYTVAASLDKVVGIYLSPRSIYLKADYGDSIAHHQGTVDPLAVTETCDFIVRKNSVEFGRVRFNNNNNAGAFISSNTNQPIFINRGDVIDMMSPSTNNSFCSNVSITLVGCAVAVECDVVVG